MQDSHERTLEWAALLALTNPKLAEKHDEMAVQSYISQKLAPFDDYQFKDKDEAEVAKYVLTHFEHEQTFEEWRLKANEKSRDNDVLQQEIRKRFPA